MTFFEPSSEAIQTSAVLSLMGALQDSQDSVEDVMRLAKRPNHFWNERDRFGVSLYVSAVRSNLALIEEHLNLKAINPSTKNTRAFRRAGR